MLLLQFCVKFNIGKFFLAVYPYTKSSRDEVTDALVWGANNQTKMMKIKKGLYLKSVISTTFLIVLVTASISGFFIHYQKNLLINSLIKRGTSLAKNLAYNSEYGVLIADKEILYKLLGGILKESDVIYASIQDIEGNILAHREVEKIKVPKYKEAIKEIKEPVIDFSSSSDRKICQIWTPVTIQKRKEEKAEIIMFKDKENPKKGIQEVIGLTSIGLSLKNMNLSLVQITRKIILITVCIIVISMGVAIFLIRAIVKPIQLLTGKAKKIAEGDLNHQVSINSKNEIGELSFAFNQMLKNLQKSRQKMENDNKTLEERIEERTKELEKTQSQLIQSAKMAAIGQLGAGVAHELNNPLGGILGYTQYLLGKVEKSNFSVKDFKNCKKYLHHIEKEASRCKEIVENLLGFSRKPTFAKKSIDIKKVLQTTLSILEHQLYLKKTKVIYSFDSNLEKVPGDANQLQQVFTNLIINAQHAMPQGGTLTITAKNREGKDIEISFSDMGHGISKDNLDKIFEPFFTTKQNWKGTGLGLSISYEIIRKHQGTIEVKSDIGKGTTFIVILPAINKFHS